MKIIGATCFALRIPFVEAFGHSASVRSRSDSVVVRLTADDGTVGYGEGLPRPYVTGETVETCVSHIAHCLWPAIADFNLPALLPGPDAVRTLDPVGRTLPDGDADDVVAWHAARAACELALLDLLLRFRNLSLGAILPPKRDAVTYSGVISGGSIDNAVRLARVCVEYGLQAVKIKIDGEDACDRVAAVRRAVGPSVSIRVDANCAYTPHEAVSTLAALAPYDIACAEQPIPRGDPAALAQVRSLSPIPIMADESLVTPDDAEALIAAKACDFFNLRISKCGGIARTLEIARKAACAGLHLQLGCQVGESAILSAAGRHVAAHLDRVSYIGTPNPSTLIRLAETALNNAQAIVRAVRDGTPGIDLPDQPQLAGQLSALMEPDPDRAKVLDGVLDRTGTLLPADCWPDLKLIGCWLGGSVGVQARRLPEYFGDVPMRDLGFLASEGHFTLPNRDHTASGILSLNGNYYEFIPEASLDDANPPVLSSHELESGVNYAVLLTTPGGLYRYDIHDIVQVTGFYRNAPLLAFIRKGRDMTSITGEKMHVNHLLLALEEVRRRYDVSVVEQFRVVANVSARRYEIYAEFKGEVAPDLLRHEVIPHLDRALAGVNVEYAEKRRSRRLAPPCLHLMRPGWAEDEVLRAAGTGKRDTQYKWRILSAEPAEEDTGAILNTLEAEEE